MSHSLTLSDFWRMGTSLSGIYSQTSLFQTFGTRVLVCEKFFFSRILMTALLQAFGIWVLACEKSPKILFLPSFAIFQRKLFSSKFICPTNDKHGKECRAHFSGLNLLGFWHSRAILASFPFCAQTFRRKILHHGEFGQEITRTQTHTHGCIAE